MSDPAALTHGRVLRIALPVVLSNATVPLLGVVDTAVVGQIGLAAPLGAVGIGAIILASVYWIFGFLRMGTTGLTAQAVGAEQREEVIALLIRALLIGGIAGLALVLAQGAIFAGAFWISPAEAEVEGLAQTYLALRIWSAPAAIALYGITGWLIAQERTRAVLILQLAMNGTNMVLDMVFVLGFGFGVAGVAVASLIAEWGGLALGLWFCRAAFQGTAWRDWPRIVDRHRLRRMAAVNGDILIRSVLLQATFLSFLFLGAEFGTLTLAANQVLLQFVHLTAYGLDGFAYAAEALVGRAFGARDRDALRRSVWLTGVWCVAIAGVMAGAYAVVGPWAIDVMTTAPDVRAEARSYLVWVALSPLLGVWPFLLDGVFIGATRTRDMRNMMALSTLAYGLTLVALTPVWGNHGLWAALMVSFTARGLTLALRYPSLEQAAGAGGQSTLA